MWKLLVCVKGTGRRLLQKYLAHNYEPIRIRICDKFPSLSFANKA